MCLSAARWVGWSVGVACGGPAGMRCVCAPMWVPRFSNSLIIPRFSNYRLVCEACVRGVGWICGPDIVSPGWYASPQPLT